MDRLAGLDTLVIQQRKSWGEMLTGWEVKNSYAILDGTGEEVYVAAETGGSMFFRLLLKALRPFTIHILEAEGRAVLRLNRPFRLYFHTLEVRGTDGRRLGRVDRRFSLLRRRYTVSDDTGPGTLSALWSAVQTLDVSDPGRGRGGWTHHQALDRDAQGEPERCG